MTIIADKIRNEKLEANLNREAAKMSALSSGKIDKYEYLTVEEILPSNQRQIIEQAKFAYFPLGKAFEKQTEKQVDAIKSLDLSNKLKRIEGTFPQNLMNDLIRAKLKEIIELQDIIKKDDLNYKSKCRKTFNFSKEGADNKQSNFANELKNFDKGMKELEKKYFLNNLGLLFSAREKNMFYFQ